MAQWPRYAALGWGGPSIWWEGRELMSDPISRLELAREERRISGMSGSGTLKIRLWR